MINPLQAMMAARAGNQNTYGAGVQNTGAVDPRVLLAAQQMNTPTIGTRIDAGNGQMVAVDPYKYADLKQQRDYQAAMNARTNNTNMQIANANNLNKQFLENQLHERNLDRDDTAFSRGQELAQTGHDNKLAQIEQQAKLDNENNLASEAREMEALKQKQQIILNGQENLMKLKNTQYGDELRGMLGNSIQTQMQWVGGQKDVTQQTYMEEAYHRKALELNQDPAIQAEYVKQQNLKGIVKPPPLKRTDGNGKINPLYQQIANDLLMQDPNLPSIQQKINSEVGSRMRNTETMINQQAMAAQQLITKTGVSPSIDPNFTATFGQALQPNLQLSGLPLPPMSGAGAGGSIAGDLDVDTSTPQGQEAVSEINSLKQVYDSLMMQVGGIGAKNEAGIAYNENPLTTGLRNIGDYAVNPNLVDTEIIDALKYAGVEDANSFTFDLDDMPGIDALSSPSEKNAHIKSELERRIAVLQKALAKSSNGE